MSIPSHLSPASSFSAQRSKINQLIDAVSDIKDGNFEDIVYFDDCFTGSLWDPNPISSGFIPHANLGNIIDYPTLNFAGVFSGPINAAAAGSHAAVSKANFPITSTSSWEFHIRFNLYWLDAGVPGSSSTVFQIGLVPKSHPQGADGSPNALSASAKAYYMAFGIANGGATTANLIGPGLTGTTNLTSLYSGYNGHDIPGNPIPRTGSRFDTLSFKVTPGWQLSIYFNGVFYASATIPGFDGTYQPRDVRFAAYQSMAEFGGILLNRVVNIDYAIAKNVNFRSFDDLP